MIYLFIFLFFVFLNKKTCKSYNKVFKFKINKILLLRICYKVIIIIFVLVHNKILILL